jgi:hypothetical protein
MTGPHGTVMDGIAVGKGNENVEKIILRFCAMQRVDTTLA